MFFIGFLYNSPEEIPKKKVVEVGARVYDIYRVPPIPKHIYLEPAKVIQIGKE